MKLSKLYSNYPKRFAPVEFREGLNVVLGRVKNPKKRDKDTHNLGKTLFAQVIDFCLMKKREKNFFLIKHEQFEDFVFFLEIETDSGEFVTVRRSVADASKGSFKKHKEPKQDFVGLPEQGWDHWQLAFKPAREMLDGLLELTVLSPWSYRQAVSYCLRSQKDYDEPFKLAKFAGSHSEWKPFLAHILGFSGKDVAKGYAIEEELAQLEQEEKRLISQASGIEDADQLRGQIQIVESDVQEVNNELDRFDFSPTDERATRALVNDLDREIVDLNAQRYRLTSEKGRIEAALNVRLAINLKSLEKLFSESKIYFGDQVKADFDALERFNRELAEERDSFLRADLEEVKELLKEIQRQLKEVNEQRSAALASLTDAKSLSKYKRLTRELVQRQTDLESLRRSEAVLEKLEGVREKIEKKKADLERNRKKLDRSIKKPPTTYANIRSSFDKTVFSVVGQHANLFSRINSQGHLEFAVDMLDKKSKPSSAGEGFTYGRVLCIAFDLAILRNYVNDPFPHFVFHDGFFETLDDRKKWNLMEVSRQHCDLGVQHIITVIESEFPGPRDGESFAFSDEEVILSLTDEGNRGRLFKMSPW